MSLLTTTIYALEEPKGPTATVSMTPFHGSSPCQKHVLLSQQRLLYIYILKQKLGQCVDCQSIDIYLPTQASPTYLGMGLGMGLRIGTWICEYRSRIGWSSHNS